MVSLMAQEFNIAEIAYAALEDMPKINQIQYLKSLQTQELRAAEMALIKQQPEEAETILINTGHIMEAISMWANFFEWDRSVKINILIFPFFSSTSNP